ncbi:MAG: ABC transporter permease [Haliscomenobacter sp.]|nr:ABC transporter permease [Haliscomenobacter sp.]MBP9077102.1 ABC transporter permease [Haliscomenobacter sp.]
MQRVLFNFLLAMEAVLANRMRALLTGLGILFGVAAVIAMLAIGSGAKQSILERMKLIGANSIVIKAVVLDPESEQEGNAQSGAGGSAGGGQKEGGKRPWSPGLTLADLEAIQNTLPQVERVSPEIVLPSSIIEAGKLEKGRCIGVTNDFFYLNNITLSQGNFFHPEHLRAGRAACVIGKNIQTRFFPNDNPLGQKIKAGQTWLTVVGVLEKRSASQESLKTLGIRDYNDDIYIPVGTALLRFKNRAVISKEDIGRGRSEPGGPVDNYHQLDRVVVQVGDSRYLRAVADVTARILKRRHRDVVDFEIEVPELLLEEQKKTQETFNLVLAAIAGISLLVGGIGIMNIMLASVMERIKEIGVRRSLGAQRSDIIQQFLFEAITISLIGGLLGILIGVVSAQIITSSFNIPALVSGWSILLSFGVAASVGLAFGIFPARKAAIQDPIKALRTE